MKLGQTALEYLECKVAIIPEMSAGHLQRDKAGVNYCLLVLWPQDLCIFVLGPNLKSEQCDDENMT